MLCVWEGTQERCVSYTKCSLKQELLTQVCALQLSCVCVFHPILQITETYLVIS